ncbi:hypothetical protein I0P70_11645 [Pontibacter sp. FD36]|uniref:hypothetical protein n=1 Tax=Pontibacter sp. FD36 TaxID=2789860 RepID=UPI0018AB2B15|nr:hypothetical protein [Pontibacter sp. FD36]MBF8963903.1 hypothetical protein [Pontibacter sp. FD36]
MKTFISDLIPKIQRYSQQLDNLTLLTNQHWVVVDDNNDTKHVYIFRSNNELLISQNGRVEKAKWEYLGHDTLLIDRKDESYLFRHGFFDENVLALKTDGNSEYAFLVNESKYNGHLNTAAKVIDFLQTRYFVSQDQLTINSALETITSDDNSPNWSKSVTNIFKTSKGRLEILKNSSDYVASRGNRVLLNGKLAPDGKYQLDFMWYIHIKEGLIIKESIF